MVAPASPPAWRDMLADLPHRERSDVEHRALGRCLRVAARRIESRSRRLVATNVERVEHGHLLTLTYADGATVSDHLHRRAERRGSALNARIRGMHRRHVAAVDALAGDVAAKRECLPADPSLRHRRQVGEALAAAVRRDERAREQAALWTDPLARDVPPPSMVDVECVVDAPRPGPAAGVAFTVA